LAEYYFDQEDFQKAIFWYRASVFRAVVDLKFYPDNSLNDVLSIFYTRFMSHVRDHIDTDEKKAEFLQQLNLASNKIIPWDKYTPRNYDSRWALLHGMSVFTNDVIPHITELQKKEIIEEEYRLFLEQTRNEKN
jgi:hypothetical protein